MFFNISGFPTQVASGGFISRKTAPPKIWTCRPGQIWSIFRQTLTQIDRKCSGAAMFVVILAGPQKVASRLDGTQNFASRADGRLGFEGKVPKVREGYLRQRCATRGKSDAVNRILSIFKSEPLMPEACLGKIV